MSAEVLRQAAALMRERAESAEPGRWKTWGMDVYADPKGTSDLDDAILVARPRTPSTSKRRLHTGNTNHIASWHPAVALAVADWLDAEAEHVDRGANSVTFDGAPMFPASQQALAVATAYLGSAS